MGRGGAVHCRPVRRWAAGQGRSEWTPRASRPVERGHARATPPGGTGPIAARPAAHSSAYERPRPASGGAPREPAAARPKQGQPSHATLRLRENAQALARPAPATAPASATPHAPPSSPRPASPAQCWQRASHPGPAASLWPHARQGTARWRRPLRRPPRRRRRPPLRCSQWAGQRPGSAAGHPCSWQRWCAAGGAAAWAPPLRRRQTAPRHERRAAACTRGRGRVAPAAWAGRSRLQLVAAGLPWREKGPVG